MIRYDNRDTGRSTSYGPGSPPYSGLDLAEDALGVLDALAVERAHLIGISMGGALAQRLAFDHPGRVASLTLISTSPAGRSAPTCPRCPRGCGTTSAVRPRPRCGPTARP